MRDLLARMVDDERFERITLFMSPRHVRNFDVPDHRRFVEDVRPMEEASTVGRILWHLGGSGRAAARVGADVLLCMNGQGLGGRVPFVSYCQQAMPYDNESLARLPWSARLRMGTVGLLTGVSARAADEVVVQTGTMAATMQRVYGLARSPTVCTPPPRPLTPDAVPPACIEAVRLVPPHARLLYVGSDSPHKNTDVIVAAMPQIRRWIPEATLFMTLPSGHRYASAPGVHCTGYLSGGELAWMYREATVLAHPSLVESAPFGLMEALAAGIPVVCADRPYGRELGRDAVLYFDPHAPEQFADKAVELLSSMDTRRRLEAARARVVAARVAEPDGYRRLLDVCVAVAGQAKARP